MVLFWRSFHIAVLCVQRAYGCPVYGLRTVDVYLCSVHERVFDSGHELVAVYDLQFAKHRHNNILQWGKRTLSPVVKVFLLLFLPGTPVVDFYSENTVQSMMRV